MKIGATIAVLLASAAFCFAQKNPTAPSSKNYSVSPCPAGKATVEMDPMGVPSELYNMIYASELIVEGTVSKVLPAFNSFPDNLLSVETDSLVLVEKVLHGALPAGAANYIALAQIGGKGVPCEVVVPDDPLVKEGERYILFLRPDTDTRKPANTTGAPRYEAVGRWAGKAKIVDGKIQFLPRAAAGLQMHNNTDANSFLQTVTDWINALYHHGPTPPYTPPPYPRR